jgi:hypothetical protein
MAPVGTPRQHEAEQKFAMSTPRVPIRKEHVAVWKNNTLTNRKVTHGTITKRHAEAYGDTTRPNSAPTHVTTRWRHVEKYGSGTCHRPDGDTWRNTVGTRGHVWRCHVSERGGDTWLHYFVPCGQITKGHMSQIWTGQVAEPSSEKCTSRKATHVVLLARLMSVHCRNGLPGRHLTALTALTGTRGSGCPFVTEKTSLMTFFVFHHCGTNLMRLSRRIEFRH